MGPNIKILLRTKQNYDIYPDDKIATDRIIFYEATIYPPKAEETQYRYGIYNEPILEIPPIPQSIIFTIDKLEMILEQMKKMRP
jgi:hypothetical protein